MISCNACLRRALNNLAIDGPSIQSTNRPCTRTRRRTSKILSSYTTSRTHATYDSLTRGHHRRLLRKAIESREPDTLPTPNSRRKGVTAFTKGEVKDALARQKNRETLLVKNDDEDRQMQRKLKKEVETYHQDPMQLSNYVQKKLRAHDFATALNLVRASDGVVTNNVVSWNHLIDYGMSQGDTEKAWKIFNEMKKRGQRGDAHTYTIMLRGYGQNIRRANVAERAVGIYNSMFAPNSNVTPNTIHTNAVLNVCARKRDMDSLWSIAGRLPSNGPGAPDRWTFTTILNAIREDATAKVAELYRNPGGNQEGSLDQRQKVIFDEALRDGRKLWADVSYRWRRADLIVDEQLVCAMGRLILGCGTTRDFREVFDLVDQAMNTRLRERKDQIKALRAPQQDLIQASTEGEQEVEGAEAEETDDKPEVQATPTEQSAGLPLDPSVVYATPSNNTLSMLMEAALGSKDMKVGKAYWTALTDQNGRYKVQPDVDNIIAYLRLLRISRASKAALDLLSQYWPNPVAARLYKRGTFVVAMSTCIRDKNSPLVFETADKILTLMQQKLEEAELGMYDQSEIEANELPFKERLRLRKERVKNVDETFGEEEGQAEIQRTKQGVESLNVDPKALRMYTELALLTTKGWSEGLKNREESDTFERDPKKNHTLRALKRIGPELINIRRLAKMKIEEADLENMPRPKVKVPGKWEKIGMSDRAGTRVAERLEDLIHLLRAITSAYDKILMVAERFEDEGLEPLDKNMVDRFRDQKRMVSGFLSRTKEEVGRVMSKKLEYSKWKGQQIRSEEDELDDEDEDDSRPRRSTNVSRNDKYNDPSSDRPHSSSSPPEYQNEEPPKIARQLLRIHLDTDRDLSRTQSRSRRQKNERRRGLDQRMTRRLPSSDYGVVGDDLTIQREDQVKERMRERAFGIRVGGDGDRNGNGNRYGSRRGGREGDRDRDGGLGRDQDRDRSRNIRTNDVRDGNGNTNTNTNTNTNEGFRPWGSSSSGGFDDGSTRRSGGYGYNNARV